MDVRRCEVGCDAVSCSVRRICDRMSDSRTADRLCGCQSIRSIRTCLSSRTTSRLIVKFKQILIHMNVKMSGYDFLKRQVFSCWRKVRSDCDVVISSSRVFQTRRQATKNARSPTVERLTDGTIDDWCHQSIMSVGRADWQQEQVAPDTSAM